MDPNPCRCRGDCPGLDVCAKPTSHRSHEGWQLRWKRPDDDMLVHAPVTGPFRGYIKLVEPHPYTSTCDECSHDPRSRLRHGIPDPWVEYLGYKELKDRGHKGKTDVRFTKNYVKLTSYMWCKMGIPLMQGIPDPWKTGALYSPDEDKRKKKRKCKQRLRSRGKKLSEPEEKRVGESSPEEEEPPQRRIRFSDREVKKRPPRKLRSDFDEFRRMMQEFDEELASKGLGGSGERDVAPKPSRSERKKAPKKETRKDVVLRRCRGKCGRMCMGKRNPGGCLEDPCGCGTKKKTSSKKATRNAESGSCTKKAGSKKSNDEPLRWTEAVESHQTECRKDEPESPERKKSTERVCWAEESPGSSGKKSSSRRTSPKGCRKKGGADRPEPSESLILVSFSDVE